MNKEDAIKKLKRQLEFIDDLKLKSRFSRDFKKWKRDTEVAIENIFGANTRHLKDFTDVSYYFAVMVMYAKEEERDAEFLEGLDNAGLVIQSLIQEVEEYWNQENINEISTDPIKLIEIICNRFHLVARQLKERYKNKNTLEIEDEYDVQDLFHALLNIYFDDIRAEEYTPNYAGACSRIDFILKQENIVIEIKKTRKGLASKEVGEQLLIDIQRYQAHPNCEILVCFVYDPEGRIVNPRGIENDLNKTSDSLIVRVFIAPKGL